jgi:hydrogenase nickel incorporation protein HypA/HybF
MHERSIARSICRQVQELAVEYPGKRVVAVDVEVGPLAGVEVALLESALQEEQSDDAVAFSIKSVTLEAACEECGKHFDVQNFTFVCPACGCVDVQVTQGDAVRIISAHLELE